MLRSGLDAPSALLETRCKKIAQIEWKEILAFYNTKERQYEKFKGLADMGATCGLKCA